MFSRIMRKTLFTRQERMLIKNQRVPFVLDSRDTESSSQDENLKPPLDITSKYYLPLLSGVYRE